MSSLITCIKKAGKALNSADAVAIKEIRDDLVKGGTNSERANQQAIDEYLGTLATDRKQMVKKIKKAGGAMPKEGVVFSDFTVANQTEQAPAQKKELPLKFRIEDEFIEKLVDKHPDNPIAQINKLGAVVEEMNSRGPKDMMDIRKSVEQAKDLSIDAALAAVPQSKLGDFIRTGMKSVREYVRTVKRMDGFINERLEEQAETGSIWKKMIRSNSSDAKLMGEIMNGATLAQTDPGKPFKLPPMFEKLDAFNKRIWMKRKRDHAILKKAWDKLTPEAQALYAKVRDDYSNIRTEVIETLEKRINESEADQMTKGQLITQLRRQFEKGKIDPYFPLARFGKHWATAQDPQTGDVIAFIKRENRAERNQWVKDMREMGYDAYASEEKSSLSENVKKMNPEFVAKVTDMTNKMEGGSALADEIWQMYLRSLPEMSARKAYIHRKGRLGFTGDALRAYGHHMFHGTHQLGKLNFGHQMQKLLTTMDKEAKELTSRADRIKNSIKNTGLKETHQVLLNFPHYKKLFDSYQGIESERINKAVEKFIKQAEVDAPWARPLANEMLKRHDYNMNPQSSLWATKLTGLGFFWFLSTSPAAGVLNLTQTAIVGLPTLGARFRMGAAAGALMKASAQLVGTRGDLLNRLRGDERKAFEEFDRIGMFSKTRVRDLTGYAERGVDFTSSWQTVMDVTGWIFHVTEKWNREVTALAAYRLAREAGRNHSDSILETEELVEMSHFDYTNTNRPRVMQGDAMRVMLLFRNYSLNMTYRLIRDFRDGVMRNPNVDVQIRNEAAKRLTGILGMTFMFAGLSGMPLGYAFHGIADALMGDEDEPFDSKAALRAHLTDQWGEDAATFITHGAWDTFTDTTLSTRASLNNLWIREVPDTLTGKDWAQHILTEAMGPLAGMVMNISEGVENVQQGHVERGVEKMIPKFAADAAKMYRFATEGALNYDLDEMMSPEEFTSWNLFTQAAGFTPAPLTTRYEQQRAIKDYEKALTTRRAHLMDRLFMAAKLGDKKEIQETMKDIAKFGRKNPTIAIDAKAIMRSAKMRNNFDMRTINGVTVPKNLHFLHEKFRMIDKKKDGKSK